ncbi:protein kinase [Opitutaceae bacterium TAV4]|nr:protein kinase [Opitutaceae bacterium TAV4]RRK02164.1 protein kinase [Opitutaceae bacterium TAV3]
MPAQVHAIGEAQNDAEREVIRRLRDSLPDSFHLIHNFELTHQRQTYEVDLAIIAPHAIYLVDVKGTRGTIYWAEGKWHPEGREPFPSPARKIREHARWLKELLFGPRHDAPWIEAVVLLSVPGATLIDPQDHDKRHVKSLAEAERFFRSPQQLNTDWDPSRLTPTGPHLATILTKLKGVGRKPKGLPAYGSWQCEERLGSSDLYTDYRAKNQHLSSGESRRVRVYRLDPYLPENLRQAELTRLGNAAQMLNKLPPHPAIPLCYDAFQSTDGDGWILLTSYLGGESLRRRLDRPQAALTVDEKLRTINLLLSGVAHCHAHGIVHRALSPTTVQLGSGGQVQLNNFELAKPLGVVREGTVIDQLSRRDAGPYMAPEVFGDATQALAPADVYSLGVTIFEVMRRAPPWKDLEEAFACGFIPVEPISSIISNLPAGFDAWLQSLCAENPAQRPTAEAALHELEKLLAPPAPAFPQQVPTPKVEIDYGNLPAGYVLLDKFSVEKKMGSGSFGVAYKVVDTFCDLPRAIKIITQDRASLIQRMKQEYRTLANIPPHPRIVRVLDGNVIQPGDFPYLVFEYVEGTDVHELIKAKKLSLPEAMQMGIQVAEGLAHLHQYRVTHGDIKPSNLLWTEQGIKILDFNVSVRASDGHATGGGSRKYLPPDFDSSIEANEHERQDRDLYALGITLYQAITGQYPWPGEKVPPLGKPPRDPSEWTGFADLAHALIEVLLKAIAPQRSNRFNSAVAFGRALQAVLDSGLRNKPIIPPVTISRGSSGGVAKPNHNPYVDYLLTLYSQSRQTNAGTRGLDDYGRQFYIETELDRSLRPAVLNGKFRLVVITGNAGDGKTAFIQQVEASALRDGGTNEPNASGNGSVFRYGNRVFRSNYDGSQDEGDKVNDIVLLEFFGPYAGKKPKDWPSQETRLIAINEGRLVDFLEKHGERFPHLRKVLREGIKSGQAQDDVAVVNLNLRSVVAEANGQEPILDRLLLRIVEPKFWTACETCDLRNRCYIQHNVRTFQDLTAGIEVRKRLRSLYELTILRSKLHLTMRDVRSALAYMLVGTRDCAEVHTLYEEGNAARILRNFYFHSWNGGAGAEGAFERQGDRLLRLLREIDIGERSEPRLDRGFDFRAPEKLGALMNFEQRGDYPRELLSILFRRLPRDPAETTLHERMIHHREYVSHLRRLYTFESRETEWQPFIPYRSAARMQELLKNPEMTRKETEKIVKAISRGEGVMDPDRLNGKLAIQVRKVDGGTMRSYRVFPADRFKLDVQTLAKSSSYLENSPQALTLSYHDEATGLKAELVINLDVFEMLERLNAGYRPTVEEMQGFYLSLNVFKNVLSSAPYQEVLLTSTGHEFHSIQRQSSGELVMAVAET